MCDHVDKLAKMEDDMARDETRMFIQWKGTELCVDFNELPCGHFGGHFDGDFAYYVRCPECGQIFQMGTEVSLTPVEDVERIDEFAVALPDPHV